MRKKNLFYTISTIMILGIFFSGFMGIKTISDDTFQPINFQREQNIVLALINYDSSYFDYQEFFSYLPSSITKTVQIDLGGGVFVAHQVTYQINYDIIFADEPYTQAVNSFVDSIAVTNATTSFLNETNLSLQREDGLQRKIFSEINGTAIPAKELETYLAMNPINTSLPLDNTYFIYAFNLSRFDTNTREHWFNVTQTDPDTQKARQSWLLEWDFPMNYGVKFPYQAYSSQKNVVLFDPTAYSWYLYWVRIWKNLQGPPLPYLSDLDHLLKNKDFDVQQLIVSQTMGEWFKELIQGGLNISPTRPIPIPQSLQVDIRVMNGLQSFNLNNNSLSWALNSNELRQELSVLYPLANTINLNVTFTDLTGDPVMNALLNSTEYFFSPRKDMASLQGVSSYGEKRSVSFMIPPPNPPKPIPIEDYRYFKADVLHDKLRSYQSQYFSPSNANITVHGFLFLMDNASLTVVQDNREYQLLTTYATNNQFTSLMELDRLYYNDHQTPKQGLTNVLLKAILHSINLPATSDVGNPVPPMLDQVMLHAGGGATSEKLYMANFLDTALSEYSQTNHFAKVQYDALLRLSADQWYEQAAYNFTILLNRYNNGSTDLGPRLRLASNLAKIYQDAYNQQDYVTALLTSNYLVQTLLTGGYIPTVTGIIPSSSTGPIPTTTVITTTEEPDRSRTIKEIPTETEDSSFGILGLVTAFMTLIVLIRFRFKK